MTAPDRIYAWPSLIAKWLCGAWSQTRFQDDAVEYLRRSPAVLAADPMVQALVAAVIEEAAKRFEELWRETSAYQAAQIRALTPAVGSALTPDTPLSWTNLTSPPMPTGHPPPRSAWSIGLQRKHCSPRPPRPPQRRR